LEVIHRYLVYSGLLDQTVGYEEYVTMLENDPINLESEEEEPISITDKDGNVIGAKKQETKNDLDLADDGEITDN